MMEKKKKKTRQNSSSSPPSSSSSSMSSAFSSSDIDSHLFTSARGLLRVLLLQDSDFSQHAEDWAISFKTFITREGLFKALTSLTLPPTIPDSQEAPAESQELGIDLTDTQVLSRLVKFLGWWIHYHPKDFSKEDPVISLFGNFNVTWEGCRGG